MITKTFELIAKTDAANQNLRETSAELEKVNKGIAETNKAGGQIKGLKKSFDSAKTGARGLAKGFRAIGVALKAAGIGLVIAAFATLQDLFRQNQKAADLFNTAFEAVAIAFNDFVNFIDDNFGKITGFFKAIFEDPLDSIKAFGDAIKNNIIERINSGLEVIGLLGKAVTAVFKGEWTEAMEAAKEAGSEYIDVLTGVDNTLEKTEEVLNEVIPAVTEYVEETTKAAAANVELKKQAELALVANQGLIEKYDLQAETLRRIRDDERNSIEVRKQANNDLAEVLDKQEKAMLANAQISLKAAQAELKKDKDNVEAKKAVMEAENELAAVRAQINSFRSEQHSNDTALTKEELELNQTVIDGVNARAKAQQDATNALIQDDVKRIQAQQQALAAEMQIEVERLTKKRDLHEKGTQDYVDANEELLNYISDSNIRVMELDQELSDAQAEISQKNADNAKAEADAKIQAQIATLNATSQALGSLAQLAGEGTKLGKAAALAQILVDTASGISSAISGATAAAAATGPAAPVVTPLLIAQLVGQVLAGMASAKAILQKVEGPTATIPSSINTGTGGQIQPQAPQFNIVGDSAFNQIAGALGQPIQAYVVAQDVTTAQQLDNGIITSATLGGG